MQDKKNLTINYKSSLIDVIKLISINKNRAVIVLRGKKVIGIISEGDVIKALLRNESLYIPLIKVMNKSFKFMKKYSDQEAKKIFKKSAISIIPVVNKNMFIKNIITLKDILKFL